jgi:AraC-like DNA-binding protein
VIAAAELMVLEVLRRHLDASAPLSSGWLAGLRDPVVAPVLALLPERPAHPWTLAELAQTTATSRTVLAERFSQTVGMPPMHDLSQWRLQLAAEQRATGQSPAAWRRSKRGALIHPARSASGSEQNQRAPCSGEMIVIPQSSIPGKGQSYRPEFNAMNPLTKHPGFAMEWMTSDEKPEKKRTNKSDTNPSKRRDPTLTRNVPTRLPQIPGVDDFCPAGLIMVTMPSSRLERTPSPLPSSQDDWEGRQQELRRLGALGAFAIHHQASGRRDGASILTSFFSNNLAAHPTCENAEKMAAQQSFDQHLRFLI